MKKLLILGFVLIASGVFAQSFVVSPFVGYSFSAFEGDYYQESGVESVLFGLSGGLLIWDNFELGLEFIYPREYVFLDHDWLEMTYQNYRIGAYGKYCFRFDRLSPFFKIGAGYFMGDGEVKRLTNEIMCMDGEFEIENSLGLTLGGGVLMESGIYVAFDYSFLSRDVLANRTCMGHGNKDMNTWDVRAGYQFSFRK